MLPKKHGGHSVFNWRMAIEIDINLFKPRRNFVFFNCFLNEDYKKVAGAAQSQDKNIS